MNWIFKKYSDITTFYRIRWQGKAVMVQKSLFSNSSVNIWGKWTFTSTCSLTKGSDARHFSSKTVIVVTGVRAGASSSFLNTRESVSLLVKGGKGRGVLGVRVGGLRHENPIIQAPVWDSSFKAHTRCKNWSSQKSLNPGQKMNFLSLPV